MIHVETLWKRYGRQPVLRGMEFEARSGSLTLMVGPNGAGKSTTMKVLAGLARPDRGVARIGGHDLARARRRALGQLAYLPQIPNFHPRFTCTQILEFYARLRGVASCRVGWALERTGLLDAATVPTGALSGGMRQRLGFALLMLPDAPVLLLDEPGLSLDPEWRQALQAYLRGEADRGKAVLVTTHLLAEWNGAADRCLLCREGRIAREIDPGALADAFGAPLLPGGLPAPAALSDASRSSTSHACDPLPA